MDLNKTGKLMIDKISPFRKDNELPFAVTKWGMKFHHIGIPTKEKKPGEKYIGQYKFYVTGFDTSEYGIEWMRFEDDSCVADIIKSIPHIAFEVDDLDAAVKGKELIGDIGSPANGIRVAMIIENGAPVEFIEFEGNKK
jgi:hypothetical protein